MRLLNKIGLGFLILVAAIAALDVLVNNPALGVLVFCIYLIEQTPLVHTNYYKGNR
jgi:hypothetical protein